MALLDKLFGRTKSLTELSTTELRKEEILIGKQRDKLIQKVENVAKQKADIFTRGSQQKSAELRKALAIEFELRDKEQLLALRELNVRSKEVLTVQRVRLMKEMQSRSGLQGRLKIGEKDFAVLGAMIEDDAVNQEMYLERLDQLLEIGAEADRDAIAGTAIGQSGSELLTLWEQLDKGELKEEEALSKAEEAVRRKASDKTS